jgi:hypothetical protein
MPGVGFFDLFKSIMKRLSAFLYIWTMSTIGLLCSFAFTTAIGHYIGLFFHNTTAGELCGIAWCIYGFVISMDELADLNAGLIDKLLVTWAN